MDRRGFLAACGALALAAAGCARGGGRDPGLTADGPDPAATARPAPTTPPTPEGADPTAAEPTEPEPTEPEPTEAPARDDGLVDVDPDDYPRSAAQWGEQVDGVRTRLATGEPEVALTFDACGGDGGSGYDAALIDALRAAGVPATLFVNLRWMEANPEVFDELVADELFEIANHGSAHLPLSVEGRSAYGIAGTDDPAGVVAEVVDCQRAIAERTGAAPRHFRPGTAHFDEVAAAIVRDLGLAPVNFDVLGDAGATFSAAQVTEALVGARAGSIALLHMNHPGSGTAQGVADAVPRLRDAGLRLVRLGDRPLV